MGAPGTSMMGREYLVQCEEEPGFKLVSGIDILEGEYRGREYRSAATDLGVAQKSVLETLNDSQNSHHRIQDRHQKLSALLPAYHDNFENQRQALQTKFARLRSVIDVLEEAVMDKATACYEEDVALVTAELERCCCCCWLLTAAVVLAADCCCCCWLLTAGCW